MLPAITSAGLVPPNALESVIVATLPAGTHTAMFADRRSGGVALVECDEMP